MNDLISQEALLKAIGTDAETDGNQRAAQVLECILTAPIVDAVPVVHGRWEQGDVYDFGDVCSRCDYDSALIPCHLNYCPNCGARMDLPEGEKAQND